MELSPSELAHLGCGIHHYLEEHDAGARGQQDLILIGSHQLDELCGVGADSRVAQLSVLELGEGCSQRQLNI